MRRLLLLGGGHAHLGVLASLAREPLPGLAVQLVTPSPQALYSGMIPGWVAGHYALSVCSIDLPSLASAAGAQLRLAQAIGIDAASRTVALDEGDPAPYDLLSLDIGSLAAMGATQGVRTHAIPMRPLEGFIAGWERVLSEAKAGRVRSLTVVGGGAAGVEVALAMAHRLRRDWPPNPPHVRVVTDGADILPGYPGLARHALRRRMAAAGVGVHCGCRVREVGHDFVRVGDGITFDNDATFWAAGAAPHAFLRDSGLQADARGFIAVNAFQQSVSHPDVFAAGDCATRVENPLPKSGVFAVRAGPALAENLRAALAGQPLRAHRPRRLHLSLLATGDGSAVGAWGPLAFGGRWVWRWKDRIDRAFVARYATHPTR